jgi:VCBS repeat-containing protein
MLLSFDPGWLVTAGGSGGSVLGYDVAADGAGNAYVTGCFSGTVDFDPGHSHPGDSDILTASDIYVDAFVAKYAPDGSLTWVDRFGGDVEVRGRAVAPDAEGNLYVAGHLGTWGTGPGTYGDFDPDPNNTVTLTSAEDAEIFVLKLDADDGGLVWARSAGGTSWDSGNEVAVDRDGNVYVSGDSSGIADFGGHSIEAYGGYVAKLSADGEFIWAKPTGSDSQGLAIDDADPLGRGVSVYSVGVFGGTCDFGQDLEGNPVTLTAEGSWDTYFLKMDPEGNVVWVEALEHGFENPGVAVDATGNVFATGGFSGTVSFYGPEGVIAPDILTSAGGYDAFALKLDCDGGLLAAVGMGGPGYYDLGRSIATQDGQVYVEGFFERTASFGDQALTSAGGKDYFLTALDADDLSTIWAQRAGGPEDEYSLCGAVAVDGAGQVYMTGEFSGTASFPTGDVATSAGSSDLFLLKLNPELRTISGTVFADLNNNGINDDGAVAPEGWTLYLDTNQNGTLDPGETTTTTGPNGGFLFGNLLPGDYRVAQQVQPRWTETLGPHEVSVSAGNAAIEFGAYVPNATKTYQSPSTGKISEQWWGSHYGFIVDESLTILDVDIQVDITHPELDDLTMTLTSPEGTVVSLVDYPRLSGADLAGTVFDDEASLPYYLGSAPYDGSTDASNGRYTAIDELRALDHQSVEGAWMLTVTDHLQDHIRGTVNDWWLQVTYIVPEGENVPPVAGDDSAGTDEDAPVTINKAALLSNDSDPDGGPISIVGFGTPGSGTVVDNGDGTITYTPDADFNGADAFTYTISDGNGGTDTATVTVAVAPVNDPPVAVDDAAVTTVGTPVTGNVLANDTDVDGDALTALAVTPPTHGELVLNADGSFTYTPDAGFLGSDSFTYLAKDGQADSNEATVTIAVNAAQPVQISIGDVSKREGRQGRETTFSFTVTRSGDTSSAVTINYETVDGTAIAGADYLAAIGSLTFDAGQTTKTISITVYGDNVAEYDETFEVRLTDQYGNELAVGTGTILNDDKGTPVGSPSATDAALMSLFAADSSKNQEEEDLLLAPLADDLALLLVA